METFKCKGSCGEWKPPTSFYVRKKKRNNHLIVPELSRDPICKECRFNERQDPEYKINAKVRKAITNEAEKLNVDSAQLHNWGITFEYLKYILKRELALAALGFHWCQNCKQDVDEPGKECYKAKNLNPDNFTLDVTDPERMYQTKKLTRSNVRWICDTANKAKGSKDPTEYDIEVIETYMQQQAFKKGIQTDLPVQPLLQPTLF